MGFWHTGYLEFHEPLGLDVGYRPSKVWCSCRHCTSTFDTMEDLRRHRFEAHPLARSMLFVQGAEIGAIPFSLPGLCCRQAQRPSSAAESDSSFAQQLLAAIREITGFGDLEFDNDGDICLPLRGRQVVFVRFSVHDGVVFAEADVAAEPIVAKHVDLALRRFCGATDGVDAMLQREFGDLTAFIEPPSGALLH